MEAQRRGVMRKERDLPMLQNFESKFESSFAALGISASHRSFKLAHWSVNIIRWYAFRLVNRSLIIRSSYYEVGRAMSYARALSDSV